MSRIKRALSPSHTGVITCADLCLINPEWSKVIFFPLQNSMLSTGNKQVLFRLVDLIYESNLIFYFCSKTNASLKYTANVFLIQNWANEIGCCLQVLLVICFRTFFFEKKNSFSSCFCWSFHSQSKQTGLTLALWPDTLWAVQSKCVQFSTRRIRELLGS